MYYGILFLTILATAKLRFSLNSKYYIGINRDHQCIIIITLILILSLFLKHDLIGNDTEAYRNLYNTILKHHSIDYILSNPYILGNSMEIGYLYLYLIFSFFNCPFRIMMLILATFYVGVISKAIYRYSEDIFLSYVLFILTGYFIFFTTNRQALALAITVMSFIFWDDGKKTKSILLFMLAPLFHKSSIIYSAFFLTHNIKWNRKKILLAILIIILLFINRNVTTNYLLEIINSNYQSMDAGGIPIILEFSIFVFMGFRHFSVISNNPTMQKMFNMMLMTLAVLPIGMFSPFFYRIRHYFAIYLIIFLPNMLKRIKIDFIDIGCLFIVFAYNAYVLFGFFQTIQATRSNPFVFFWQNYPAGRVSKGAHIYPKW